MSNVLSLYWILTTHDGIIASGDACNYLLKGISQNTLGLT